MKEYVKILMQVAPSFERLEVRLDCMLDKLSVCFGSNTEEVATAVMHVIDLKRQLVDLFDAYEYMVNRLTYIERRVLEGRLTHVKDQSLADELGVSRNTVRALRNSALLKCTIALEKLNARGLNLEDCADVLRLANIHLPASKVTYVKKTA